jgi:hypothetical protein
MIITFDKKYWLKNISSIVDNRVIFARLGITGSFIPKHVISCELVGILTIYDIRKWVSITMEEVEDYLIEIDNSRSIKKVEDLYL